jgi:aminomuconate-semialdehyde/2-hydroxymuconate-6-semialdehyde dehydrogenase
VIINNYINGQFVAGGRPFDNINPVDGSLICQVSEASESQVNDAVLAARQAFHGPWASLNVNQRCDLLHAVADGITQRFDDFVEAEIADTGKPLAQTRTLDIPRGAANFKMFADLARTTGGECFHTQTPAGDALNYSINKPLGVIGVISPWNLPLLLMTWKLAPALASGNTIVAKPSEETPSSANLLAEVMHSVGVPAGVFNLIHGFGSGSAGEFLTRHEGVDAITFTGESNTGSAIMKAVADTVKPISFELGGKNAAIIFEDSDFDAAVEGTAKSTFTNCGQVCLCTERVYVQRPIYDRFVAALKEKAESIVIGRPHDEGTAIGPLISMKHREKVASYYDLAREEGATVVTGGGIPKFGDERDQGAWIQPTILTGLSEQARCVKEEIFGPICHVTPFDTEEQAINMANDSKYGLAAAIWTTDLQRAHRVAAKIEAGLVWVNTWYLRDLRTSFGGVKLSGIGREGGLHSLRFYSEPTNICIKL